MPDYDGFPRMNLNEKRPVYFAIDAGGGTLALSATPQIIITDSAGASKYSGNATGYDTGDKAAPRVWHDIDTSGWAVGYYDVKMTCTAQGKDSGGTAESFTRNYVRWQRLRVV